MLKQKLANFWNLQENERQFVLMGAVGFCLLLASYTSLRPIRDELGIRGGVESLHWSFTFTLIAMTFVVPFVGAVATWLPKNKVIPTVYLFFFVNLLCFAGYLFSNNPLGFFPQIFFSWVSVFNLVVISLFWTALSDRCEESKARLLFGPIAAGGSFGAFIGPVITSQWVRSLGSPGLLLISAALLFLSAVALQFVPNLQREGKVANKVPQSEPIGGEILNGLLSIPGSTFLILLTYLTFVGNILGTYLYFQQAEILSQNVSDPIRRTEILSSIDITVNALSFAFQLFLTPFLLKSVAPKYSFTIVPAALCIGFPVLLIYPTVNTLFGFQTLRRATLYALSKPVESILYSVRSDEEGYKARNVIDTLIYRLGDTSGAWLTSLVRYTAYEPILAWCAPLLALSLAVTTYYLGREHEKTVNVK